MTLQQIRRYWVQKWYNKRREKARITVNPPGGYLPTVGSAWNDATTWSDTSNWSDQ